MKWVSARYCTVLYGTESKRVEAERSHDSIPGLASQVGSTETHGHCCIIGEFASFSIRLRGG